MGKINITIFGNVNNILYTATKSTCKIDAWLNAHYSAWCYDILTNLVKAWILVNLHPQCLSLTMT